jgi:type IV secretion system protein VirD4
MSSNRGNTVPIPGFPPRGSGLPGVPEVSQSRTWGHPHKLGRGWDWKPGKILLGEWEGRLLGEPDRVHAGDGSGDDRHLMTVAGSRAGKSKTVLIPNLMRYPGSVIVIDPKGELARATAAHRRSLGQTVVVLDPFGTTGETGDCYNPLDELDPNADTFVDDVALVADALILDAEKDQHWTDSAKNLVRGLILYLFASEGVVSLPRLRRILLGAEGSLKRPGDGDGPDSNLFMRMALMDDFDELLALTGRTFQEKGERELGSILSTAREQLSFLDSVPLGRALHSSPLRLRALKQRPATVYLCLPAARLATHARWLRLIVTLGFAETERDETVPRHPVLFMLEEFGALGYLRSIERAAGFMAGFGLRLWPVVQDFTQLKQHYPNSWETFLGNAGIIQAFGNVDLMTTQHLSRMMGTARVVEIQHVHVSSKANDAGDLGRREHVRSVPLLEAAEIALYFARETGRQLIIVPGRPPLYMNRMPHGSA